MSEIVYRFEENRGFLESMSSKIQEIVGLRQEIQRGFQLLNEVFKGQTQEALNVKAAEIDQLMEDLGDDINQTHTAAQNKQDAVQELDRQRAGGF
ncbi:hypothetical protein BKG69_23285 [Mycobacteroides chelonae]|uniref:hypothetical protein n=1 Tax=Mycobacteroides TaxID=670516 RepID=UPI0008A85CBB|nr:hypothetical protein [Mycobacteroides chelonae]AYM40719.1 hypothetical protein DYE20_03335 [[Mycobacterium] chelonae subsp. gwanakae]OHT77315.1 hypothetical protein BKG69_23285 [Mycobacteroides chelonae]OHU16295.1 hypothetical protein BKG75_14965 [Mycobacteroides chelonae]GLE55291.1 hypothetical protein NJBCHELONAE_06020 [Mycobacteroides chelonae]